MTTSLSSPTPRRRDVALAILRYFPHGGLQRIALGVAQALSKRGHRVRLFTQSWDGPLPSDQSIQTECLPGRGTTNHVRAKSFAAQLRHALQSAPADVVLGFDRLPGLDLYFGGDPCYSARLRRDRSALARWTPRARTFLALERAVFAPEARPRILLMNPAEAAVIRAEYGTPEDRFRVLPPGFMAPGLAFSKDPAEREKRREVARQRLFEELGLRRASCLVALGSDFHRKGFDRAVRALAAARDRGHSAVLLVAGSDSAGRLLRLSRSLGVGESVRLLGPRDDTEDILNAADILIHPARSEPAGMVILEALAAGCPVLTTAAVGYAEHVTRAGAGAVLTAPFKQALLDAALVDLLTQPSEIPRQRAYDYADTLDPRAMERSVVHEVESHLRVGP
ncbi:MAG: glycosyltransferase family 4 protein [Planctomycetota bacterium]